jgi:carboxypeptidase Taq
MKIKNTSVKQLLEKYKEISTLSRVSALLSWDLNVNLPPKAAASRAEDSAYMAKTITQKWLDPEFKKLLEKASEQKYLTLEEKAIVRNLNRGGHYYYNVPKEVIVQKEEVTSNAFPVWNAAREEKNFKKFLPHLEKIIDLDRQIAGHLGYKENAYDALLDLYEPELTAKECEALFTNVKKELVPLIKKIIEKQKESNKGNVLKGKKVYAKEKQEQLLRYAITSMGFDFTRGRIDVSPHPFTIGLAQHDVRLTTHYNENDFRESFTAAMHEAGHGLYEQGVSSEYAGTPLEGGVSLGIHEALSRFWENMIGKNPEYLSAILPQFRKYLGGELTGITDKDIIASFNTVNPSLIRIHADEVTYSLHIVLRFEMENALINGKIAVKDAATAWNEKSKQLFGITPKNDSEGVLQDVHWTYGSIGYFPSYALGNLYGAQFLDQMKKDLQFTTELKKANLAPVKSWFDKNIHQCGSLYLPKDLIKRVTGKPLDYTYFVKYLKEKFN